MKHIVRCFPVQDKRAGSRRVVIADEPEWWTNTINTPQTQGTVVIIEFSLYKVLFYSTSPLILAITLWINETRNHYPYFPDKKIRESDSTTEESQLGKREQWILKVYQISQIFVVKIWLKDRITSSDLNTKTSIREWEFDITTQDLFRSKAQLQYNHKFLSWWNHSNGVT